MQKSGLISSVLLLSVVLFFSCSKGDTGPAGTNGTNGNANVIYSGWNNLAMNLLASTPDSVYGQDITADSLTQSIIDSGVVLTYIKIVDPDTRQISIVNAGSYMEEFFSAKTISLYSSYNFSGLGFRYVLIPGGTKSGRVTASGISIIQGYTKEQWQAMKYEQVIALLNTNKKLKE